MKTLLAALLVALAFTVNTAATVKDVSCIAGVDCGPTIQAAIDGAASGDIIQLGAGTHIVRSPILINKPLTLRGVSIANTTLVHNINIGLDGSAGMIHIGGLPRILSDVTISGLTIRADRAANPKMRTIGIRIRGRSNNITVNH
jgi:hypothetical protein